MTEKLLQVQTHLDEMLPDLLTRKVEKAQRQDRVFTVKGYWCGTVLRFDIKETI